MIVFNGSIREEIGGSSARKLKKEGKIPAVIYGEKDKPNVNISLDLKEFEKEYKKGCIETKNIEIKTDKESFEVVCYQIDLDPVSDRPRHIDFISTKGKKEVKVLVPIKYTNRDKALGLKNGGFVNILVRKVQVICDPKKIPAYFEIDCTPLRLKQSVMLFDLKLSDGAKLVSKKNIMLVKVIGRGKDTLDEDGNKDGATTTATATTATTTSTAGQTTAKK